MKKIIVIAGVALLALASCKKDKPEPVTPPTPPPVENPAPPKAPEPQAEATPVSPATAPELKPVVEKIPEGASPSNAPDEKKSLATVKTLNVLTKSKKEIKVVD
jgi:hypothetical protein